MPNANWSNPTTASLVASFVTEVKARDEDLAIQFDGSSATNIPTGTIRWNSTINRWQKWSGTAWGELATTYALTGLSTTGVTNINTTSANTIQVNTGTTDGASFFPPNTAGGVLQMSNDNILIYARRRTTDGTVVQFQRDLSIVGSISVTTTNTTYATTSDYRLKENVIPISGSISRLLQLKPSRFNFKAAPDTVVDGFIAHEAQEVVPECVVGTKDEQDANGNPVYQGIDHSKIVPLLTAALQETLKRVEQLEASVAALQCQ